MGEVVCIICTRLRFVTRLVRHTSRVATTVVRTTSYVLHNSSTGAEASFGTLDRALRAVNREVDLRDDWMIFEFTYDPLPTQTDSGVRLRAFGHGHEPCRLVVA